MKTVVLTSLCLAMVSLILVGCPTDEILKIRRDMMMSSLFFCTSQYEAAVGNKVDLSFSFEGQGIHYGSDVQRYWNGIISDGDFRQDLLDAGIDPVEFQARVSECQREWLERDGYFDLIRPA